MGSPQKETIEAILKTREKKTPSRGELHSWDWTRGYDGVTVEVSRTGLVKAASRFEGGSVVYVKEKKTSKNLSKEKRTKPGVRKRWPESWKASNDDSSAPRRRLRGVVRIFPREPKARMKKDQDRRAEDREDITMAVQEREIRLRRGPEIGVARKEERGCISGRAPGGCQ